MEKPKKAVEENAPVDPRRKRTMKEMLKHAVGRIYNILASPLGLILLLLIYSFIGAAIFRAIEGPWEEEQNAARVTVREARGNLTEHLRPMLTNNVTNLTAILEQRLSEYEELLYAAFQNGVDSEEHGHKIWDFWGSFLFCGTIYTTIGYGHISPATKAGKIATMCYAILGVPLCLIVMASLGRFLSRLFKWVWHRIRCRHKKRKQNSSLHSKDDHNANEHPMEETEVVLNLPVLVAIGIVFTYICIGAGLYCIWEPWSYLQAFYFIFISISTIGFGDVVPHHPHYFLASSLYILFGLSLVAMTITVMMESLAETMFNAKARIEHTIARFIKQVELKADSPIYEPVEIREHDV